MSQNTKSTVVSDEFWSDINVLHQIIQTISDRIKSFESDESKISSCVPTFVEIKRKLQEIDATFLSSSKEELIEIVNKRKDFSIKSIHNAAYLVDPKYRGEDLTQSDHNDALQFLVKLAENNPNISVPELMNDIMQFKTKQGMFSPNFLWEFLKPGGVNPSTWWAACFPKSPLSEIAQKILQAPPTSSACERSFSMQKDVHSLKRNRLTNEKVNKLMHIKSDLKTISKTCPKRKPLKDTHEESPHAEEEEDFEYRQADEDPTVSQEEEVMEGTSFQDANETDPLHGIGSYAKLYPHAEEEEDFEYRQADEYLTDSQDEEIIEYLEED